jgi:hypothetical protein
MHVVKKKKKNWVQPFLPNLSVEEEDRYLM